MVSTNNITLLCFCPTCDNHDLLFLIFLVNCRAIDTFKDHVKVTAAHVAVENEESSYKSNSEFERALESHKDPKLRGKVAVEDHIKVVASHAAVENEESSCENSSEFESALEDESSLSCSNGHGVAESRIPMKMIILSKLECWNL